MKKIISAFIISFIYLSLACAEKCMELGPNPSLIVEFNTPKDKELSSSILNQFNVPPVAFVRSQHMSDNSYVIFFTGLSESSPGCYDSNKVEDLMAKIKSNPDVKSVSPNRLMHTMGINKVK